MNIEEKEEKAGRRTRKKERSPEEERGKRREVRRKNEKMTSVTLVARRCSVTLVATGRRSVRTFVANAGEHCGASSVPAVLSAVAKRGFSSAPSAGADNSVLLHSAPQHYRRSSDGEDGISDAANSDLTRCSDNPNHFRFPGQPGRGQPRPGSASAAATAAQRGGDEDDGHDDGNGNGNGRDYNGHHNCDGHHDDYDGDHDYDEPSSPSFQLLHTKFERLSKRIALSGIMSRKEADKALREGLVSVDGRVCGENVMVADEAKVVVRRWFACAGVIIPLCYSCFVELLLIR